MKRIFVLALALACMLAAGCDFEKEPAKADAAPEAADAQAPRGFDTPEACAQAVADHLLALDAEGLLECFAIPEVARDFDLAAYVARINALQPGNTLLDPTSEFNIAYNEARLNRDVLNRVAATGILLKSAGKQDVLYVMMSGTKYTQEELLDTVDWNGTYAGIAYRGIVPAQDVVEPYTEKAVEQAEKSYAVYGVTTWEDWVLTFDYRGTTLYMPLTFAKYGDKWLAAPFVSTVSLMLEIRYDCLFAGDIGN